jgi:hypothetical protein
VKSDYNWDAARTAGAAVLLGACAKSPAAKEPPKEKAPFSQIDRNFCSLANE